MKSFSLFPSVLWDTGGWKFKRMILSVVAFILLLEYAPITDGAAMTTGVKYLYYLGENRIANWTNAVAKCKEQGGDLTPDIDIDDWELLYGKSSVFLDDNYFWIGLKRHPNKEWKWLDGSALDLNMTASFPLRPEFKDNITWDCVQWNVKEPFYVPQGCHELSPFICKIPNSMCAFHSQGKMQVNETIQNFMDPAQVDLSPSSMPVYLTMNKTISECEKTCFTYDHNNLECWLFEYLSGVDINKCRLVISDSKPVLINLKDAPTVELFAKYCVEGINIDDVMKGPRYSYGGGNGQESQFTVKVMVEKFTHCKDGEECICGNVTSNPTPEQLEEILEETKEKLTVSTKNLSATIRKKTSAADDRPSSQTMGYFGITMITITLGGLVLLDCTSMMRDLKIMMYNLRCMTSSQRDLPPPTMLQVNLQGGPKSSYA